MTGSGCKWTSLADVRFPKAVILCRCNRTPPFDPFQTFVSWLSALFSYHRLEREVVDHQAFAQCI